MGRATFASDSGLETAWVDAQERWDSDPVGEGIRYAQGKGYTRNITATSDAVDFEDLWVKPDADLDGTFRAWDADEQEWVKVNGWLFILENAA